MYAFVVLDITSSAIDKPFLYMVPEKLKESLEIGSSVLVPFGKGNTLKTAYIIGLEASVSHNDKRLDNKSLSELKLKEISSLSPKKLPISSRLLSLAVWLKNRYGSTLANAINTVIISKEKVRLHKHMLISLNVSDEKLNSYMQKNVKNSHKARLRLINALISNRVIDDEIVRQLSIGRTAIDRLKADGIISVDEDVRFKKDKPIIKDDIVLSDEQRKVVDGIADYCEEMKDTGDVAISLVHGVTGSGKTNVYIELIKRVVNNNKQAILLIPEISLTQQNILRFHKSFADRVSFIHSRLSKTERYERILKAENKEIDIMIGPRTALFTPFDDIGIIIIDEEHESSYNSDRTPKYSAIEVAIKIASMHGAAVVLGSATPSVESYYRAINGEYKLFEMKNRYGVAQLPKIQVVDLKKELIAGNRDIFSRDLIRLIDDRLGKKEQVMLFLNRRGYYGFNACKACGEVIKCPHCDVALSLHADGKLKCHYCGYEVKAYSRCPSCGSSYIGSMNEGTQQVEERLKAYFPDIRILRMDADTTARKEGADRILESFSNYEADVLIGTQMIVKGHDFPRVTLMGVLIADMALNISNYTAGERCFQILMQASGRAGRAEKKGAVIMQTYRPEHFCIEMAKKGDYKGFYNEEIQYRKLMSYPPFSKLILIIMQSKNEEYLEKATFYMKAFLDKESEKNHVMIIGPSTPAIAKLNDMYRKYIYLKHHDINRLLYLRNRIMAYVEINRGYDMVDVQFEYKPE